MPNEHDVNILLFEKIDVYVFILCPLSGHEGGNADLRVILPDDNFLLFLNDHLFYFWLFNLLLRPISFLVISIQTEIMSLI